MLCGMIPKMKKKKSNSVPVYLNVYDLLGFTPINDYAYWLGLGVYHSGVEVHGVEYGFEGNNDATTGVFEVEPKQCPDFMFRKSILIGSTDHSAIEVDALVDNWLTTTLAIRTIYYDEIAITFPKIFVNF
ncbi:hypothetical protein RDABS01_001157 [Bienertia sinuspersici]